MKRLPMSVENFKEMMKGDYYYVDKSLLVRDVVTLSGKVKLITRPRRFGKTLSMDMMKRFFSMDEEDELFEGLRIWKERDVVKEHYHRYPVIYVTFKSVKGSTWGDAYSRMRSELSELAKRYLDWAVDGDDERYLRRIVEKRADKADYEDVLWKISKMVYRKKSIPPIILIDEYDVPIESAYANRERDPSYYDRMVDFMRAFLTSALKGSDVYFSLAVLTGVYRIAKESIFSGLNNLVVFSIFDNQMSDKYGFTEEEVVGMLEHYGLTREDKKLVDEWYGNYRVGKSENLYNPWSVINYIATRVEGGLSPEEAARKYWVNTSENAIIVEQVQKNEEIKSFIDELLQGKEIVVSVDPSLSLREIEEYETGVWVLFASGGYLNARWADIGKYGFRIPNEEIMLFFKESVIRWINKKTSMKVGKLYSGLDEMLRRGEYEDFLKHLKDFLESGMSYYDVAKSEPERFYKGFLLGMLAIAVNGYRVESEMESGYGRLDVVIYPKSEEYGKFAAVFEVKRSDSMEKLQELSKRALEQIKSGKYYAKVRNMGYGVVAFGIAFCGKKVEVEVELIH